MGFFNKKTKFGMLLKQHWVIVVIILFSLLARAYKIDCNLPNLYWHDENNYVETALRFGTGNFKPHLFRHGMLLPLILFFEYTTYYLAESIAVASYTPLDFLTKYVTDPTNFYLISRITVMLFGIGCVFLVYLIALKFYNKKVANLASLFFAFSFVPFINSKWTKADMISVFFLLLAFLIIIQLFVNSRNFKRQAIFYYGISGFFVGLAAAAKLYAIFGISFVILIHLFTYRDNVARAKKLNYLAHFFDIKIMICGLFFILGFILGNPYIVINPKFFYADMLFMRRCLFDPNASNTWLSYFTDHLKNVIGSVWLGILVLISCIFFILKRSKKEIILLVFPAILYLGYMNYPGFAHYLVPVVPFLVIIAASFLDTVFKKSLKWKKNLFIAIIVFMCVYPCFRNILCYSILISRPDTRTIAKDWMEKNILEYYSILSEGYIYTEPVMVPPLKSNLKTLQRDLILVKSMDGKGNLINQRIECAMNDIISKRYNIYKVRNINVETLKRINADYVITSGYVDMNIGEREYSKEAYFYKKREEFYNTLNKKYTLVKDFKPYPALGSYFPLLLIEDFKKIESINLLKDLPKLCRGPEIKIYQIKSK